MLAICLGKLAGLQLLPGNKKAQHNKTVQLIQANCKMKETMFETNNNFAHIY